VNERQDGGAFPDHSDQVSPEVHDLIGRMHWQRARSVEHVAPHAYNVKGWNKDRVTTADFWRVVVAVKAIGRLEEWTPPAGFYDSGNRRPMWNRYLYIGEFAYWFTRPENGPAMRNRENVSVQRDRPTRRAVGQDDLEPAPLEAHLGQLALFEM
jgi:hypothetical protein